MLVVFVSIAEQEEGEEEGVLLLCNKVLVKPFPSSSWGWTVLSSHSSPLITVHIHFTRSMFMIFTHARAVCLLSWVAQTFKWSDIDKEAEMHICVSNVQSEKKPTIFPSHQSNANVFSRSVRLKLGQDSSEGWVQWILSESSARAKLDWLAGQAPLPGRWDPIIRQTRTPPPGFHSSTVYHMALSSWAPLTDNERRQPVQLQAKHSTFYRPKHVSGKLTVSIQFCSAFKRPITIPFPWATPPPRHPLFLQLQCLRSRQNKNWLLGASFWIQKKWNLTELCAARKRKMTLFCDTLFPKD